MEASVKLGHIWGIPIGLHVSWFLIFGLVTWSLAQGYFPTAYPDVPVVEGNDIVGMLSREHLLHYLRTRAELGM